MSQEAMEEVAKKGICSIESIEKLKHIADELDMEPNRSGILDCERILKAAADRTRIKLLLLLSRGEMCVCQLTAISDLKQPAISSSLRILERAGLLRREQRGKWHYYSLTDSRIIPLIHRLVERRD